MAILLLVRTCLLTTQLYLSLTAAQYVDGTLGFYQTPESWQITILTLHFSAPLALRMCLMDICTPTMSAVLALLLWVVLAKATRTLRLSVWTHGVTAVEIIGSIIPLSRRVISLAVSMNWLVIVGFWTGVCVCCLLPSASFHTLDRALNFWIRKGCGRTSGIEYSWPKTWTLLWRELKWHGISQYAFISSAGLFLDPPQGKSSAEWWYRVFYHTTPIQLSGDMLLVISGWWLLSVTAVAIIQPTIKFPYDAPLAVVLPLGAVVTFAAISSVTSHPPP